MSPFQQAQDEPETGAEQASEAAGGQGKEVAAVIEIYCYADGTYRVSRESPQQEAEEHEATGTEQGENGQDFPSAGEALKAVLDIMKASPAGDESQAFQAGYSGDAMPQRKPIAGQM